MTSSRCRPEVRITSTFSRVSGSSSRDSTTLAMPMTPLSGLRTSCDTVATNFDLAASAASARSVIARQSRGALGDAGLELTLVRRHVGEGAKPVEVDRVHELAGSDQEVEIEDRRQIGPVVHRPGLAEHQIERGVRGEERERRAVEAAPLHGDPKAERHGDEQRKPARRGPARSAPGAAARARRAGRSPSAAIPKAGRGSASTRRYSRTLSRIEHAVMMPSGSKAIAWTAAIPGAGGGARTPARPAAKSPAATVAVKARMPTRKISHSWVLVSGRRRRASARIAEEPTSAAKPCEAASARIAPGGRAPISPASAKPAAAARAPRPRATSPATSATPDAGVAPSTTPSPKPSARHTSRRLMTPSATSTSGQGRIVVLRRTHVVPGQFSRPRTRGPSEPRRFRADAEDVSARADRNTPSQPLVDLRLALRNVKRNAPTRGGSKPVV